MRGEKKTLLFAIGILFLGLASALQIECLYYGENGEAGGLKIWSNLNITGSSLVQNLLGENLTEQELNEHNCSISSETNLTEVECKRYFSPVINILNSNIEQKNLKIKKLNYLLIGSIIIFALIVLREIYLWRSGRENA